MTRAVVGIAAAFSIAALWLVLPIWAEALSYKAPVTYAGPALLVVAAIAAIQRERFQPGTLFALSMFSLVVASAAAALWQLFELSYLSSLACCLFAAFLTLYDLEHRRDSEAAEAPAKPSSAA